MPMGPFELLDEIGLDVSAHVLKSLGEQVGMDRVPSSPGMFKAIEQGWLGKKSGRGFYHHGAKGGSKPKLNEEMTAFIGSRAGGDSSPAMMEPIAWRLILPMVNEAARVLEEGVVHDADAVDLAMVLGTGFAPFRGGLVQFADSVGVEAIRERLAQLAVEVNPRFIPAPLLSRLAVAHLPLREYWKLPARTIDSPVHQEA